jgi:4-aminobutyrate aminotransferase-like enzyme
MTDHESMTAVEATLKFARCATGRPGIVYCDHAFHGLSYAASAALSQGLLAIAGAAIVFTPSHF